MKREPTMHIKLEDFAEILKSEGIRAYKQLALNIFRKAVTVAVKDRYIISGGADLQQKARKVIRANKDTPIPVNVFNRILVEERTNAGHRNINLIRTGDSNFTVLKEVSQIAADFCREFEYSDYMVGSRVFLNIGIDMMGSKFSLTRFKSTYITDRIKRRVTVLTELREDENSDGRRTIYCL